VERGRPWSQEQLALAMGTGQAHISRIEGNRQVPDYATMARICEALDLSQVDRSYLLTLAGYQLMPPLPEPAAIERVMTKLRPVVDSYPYPAVLLDESERQWYQNWLAAELWGQCFGSTDHSGLIELIRGRRSVEFLFDPAISADRRPLWQAAYGDLEHIMDRNVALFWRTCKLRPDDLEQSAIAARLMANPEFSSRWERMEEGVSDLSFLDHAIYAIRSASYGRVTVNAWRTRTAVDERFIVTHFLPADDEARRALERALESRRHEK
jgi:transcriptional regulator with XRE-family HTH domain